MRTTSAIAIFLAASLPTSTAIAQVPAEAPNALEAPAAFETPAAPQLTRSDLEAWLDGFMPFAIDRGDIPGAVVVVVKDGAVLLHKGYGYADVEKKKPVDPEQTLFRPGSVSKLFTWTAVMQQVERGKFDLDADVNQYLDFQIPPGPGGTPVRLRDILTHTPGFEEAVKELIADDPARLVSIEASVKRWVPKRIYEAGKMPAYSNYATALAGYMVERSSGLSFDDYIDQHIFAPLGMTRSSFRQPLPDPLLADMSQGYKSGSDEPQPYELISMAPAGSLAATASDMAKFMIAHLQNGAYGEHRILAEDTAKQMHGTPLTIIPGLNRMLLGFYESNTNGRRSISHGGDTQWFHSDLHLYIDDGVGYFISVNSGGKDGASGSLRSAFFRAFSDRYLPGPGFEGQIDEETAKEHARQIAGTYILSRRAESSLISVLNFVQPMKVIVNKDGTISLPLLRSLSGEPVKWRETEPYVWVDAAGKNRLAAEVVDDRVTRFSAGFLGPIIYLERAPTAKAGAWVMPAVSASLVALLLTAIFWPVGALVRRHYRKPLPFAGAEARAYRWVRIGALASLLAIVAWGATIIAMFEDLALLTDRMDAWLLILHILGSIAVFAGFALALWHLAVVFRVRKRWLGKIWAIVLVLATTVLAWIAIVYHLVGFGVNY
ncbi:MAG: serine hydrolase domain-containing protein [Steroidobacteraceae bacterium]